jgi:hypothetical protein
MSSILLSAMQRTGPAGFKLRFLLIECAWAATNQGDKGTVASLSGGDGSYFDVGGFGVIIVTIGP